MNIPLHIHEKTGIDRVSEIIVGGVPVPKGMLQEGGWFELTDEDGNDFLAEGSAAARWPDGSVKWLHLCGAVNLRGGADNLFRLRPASRTPESELEAQTDKLETHIKGGALEVFLSTDDATCLSVTDAATQVSLLAAPGLSASLELVGPDGANRRQHHLHWKAEPTEIVAAGPNRVVSRLAGEFVDAGGHPVSELVLFAEVLRQVRQVRLQPVFIYLGDPERDLVASLELRVHTGIKGDACSYAFANERGRGYVDVVQPYEGGPRWPQARLLQLGSSFYRTNERERKARGSKLSKGRALRDGVICRADTEG